MLYSEAGRSNDKVVILLSQNRDIQQLTNVTSELPKKYHTIVMQLEDQNDPEKVQKEAAEVERYLIETCEGSVYALCGTASSWGCINRIVQNNQVHVERLVYESDRKVHGDIILSALHQ